MYHCFIQLYLSIDPELRKPRLINGRSIEKYLLRKAFDKTGLLPDAVLWRQKEAFSDGVSSNERSLYQILQEHAATMVPPTALQECKYTHNPPKTAEQYYYRSLFESYYPNMGSVVPYYWMPKWIEATDPSARTLSIYKSDN